MLGKLAVVFTDQTALSRPLVMGLRGIGAEAVHSSEPEPVCNLLNSGLVDLLIVDLAVSGAISQVLAAADDELPIVAITGARSAFTLADTVCDLNLRHVVRMAGADGSPTAADLRDLLVTSRKMLRGDLFGIDKYLGAAVADVSKFQLRSSQDRDDLSECLADYLTWLGVRRQLRTRLINIADELVTNAVYNAPVGPDGAALFHHCDRRHKLALEPGQFVDVEFACDGEQFVIAVTDNFGSLSLDRIRQRVRACSRGGQQIEQKKGGAGLGMYQVLKTADTVVINIEPGRRCQILVSVAVVPDAAADGAGSSLVERHAKFHFFTARRRAAGTVRHRTVEVAEELRPEMVSELVGRRHGLVIPLTRRKGVTKRRLKTVSGVCPEGTELSSLPRRPGSNMVVVSGVAGPRRW